MDRRKSILRIAAWGLLIVFLFYFFIQAGGFWKKDRHFGQLKGEVARLFQDKNLRYSILIKDLRFPGLRHNFNSDKQFVAASLIKLPMLAAALKAVEEGKISLQDKITISVADVTGGSGKLKTSTLPKVISFEELLKYMISISDNTATNKVISILGFEYFNERFKEFGLKNTVLRRKMMDFRNRKKGIENYTSSRDIGLILERFYNKALVNKELCDFALKLLKEQTVNDRLPRYLPEDIEIAHKTGLERGVIHDAGIVFAPGGDYMICVLLGNVNDYKTAKKIIAQTSLFTYNLYQ